MSDNKTPPHIRIPRSLREDPLWRKLPLAYREVFVTLLHIVCFKSQKFDDHGVILDLKPGQICISDRELTEQCGDFVSRNDVQRSILKFKKYGFCSQEVSHIRNVITITHPDTYELICLASEPRSEPKLSQDRAKIEPQKKKEKKEKKEKNIYTPSANASALLVFFNDSLKKSVPEVTVFDIDPKAAEPFDKLMESYSFEEIKAVVDFAHNDDFWRDKVHNSKYLLKKDRYGQQTFPKLLAASRRKMTPKKTEQQKHRFAYEEYNAAF